MTSPARAYADLVAELGAALTTAGPDPGDDHLGDRLDRALDAAWELATRAGVADSVAVIAGADPGPAPPAASTLELARQQVTRRTRGGDTARWRTMAEKAGQLDALLRALPAAGDTSATRPPGAPPPARGWPDALWVGTWDPAVSAVGGRDDRTSTYGSVQHERVGQKIVNSPIAPRVPVADHSHLGRALRLSLGPGVQRHEVQAAGDADSGWGPGTERWFGFRFALAGDFPLEQRDTWAIISQVHQASHSGPPPLELDACRGGLWLRGRGDAYLREVCRLEVDRAYDVVVGLRIGRGVGASRVDVLVDGGHLIRDYRPPVDFGAGCYWKVASAYARPSIRRPWTVFQRDHRIGATLAAVR